MANLLVRDGRNLNLVKSTKRAEIYQTAAALPTSDLLVKIYEEKLSWPQYLHDHRLSKTSSCPKGLNGEACFCFLRLGLQCLPLLEGGIFWDVDYLLLYPREWSWMVAGWQTDWVAFWAFECGWENSPRCLRKHMQGLSRSWVSGICGLRIPE